MKSTTKVLFFLLLTFTSLSVAAVPQQINYSGSLTRTNGSPLDTTVGITFKLYTDSTTGSLLWTETRSSVTVQNGIFNVRLGQLTALTDAIINQTQLWLGVTVGSDAEMTPRSRLVSVPYSYRIGTVDGASGGTISGKLNVGSGNTNAGSFANVHGQNNHSIGDYSTIAGGGDVNASFGDSASGNYSAIGGGSNNTASAVGATISGGQNNRVSSTGATVSGGENNTASGFEATIGGGQDNIASAQTATVGGGTNNIASQSWSAIGGGEFNNASNIGATVSGGGYNKARGQFSVVAGGGGQTAADSNLASGSWATISGGRINTADHDYATIGGGQNNNAVFTYATIGGGFNNTIQSSYGCIPGGHDNQVGIVGDASFAAGQHAIADDNNSFVWNSSSTATHSFGTATFTARAWGGVRFYSNASATNVGVELTAGSGAWNSLSDSTAKHRLGTVNTKEILQKVCSLPIERWSYKTQDEKIQHIGPMAQDFYNAFKLGDDDKTICTIDPDGIALAAIQELSKENQKLEMKNEKLEEQNSQLEIRMKKLEQLVEQMAGVKSGGVKKATWEKN